MNVLLTGGAGYIGSHTFISLKESDHHPIILDNFINSSRTMIDRLRSLTQAEVVCEEGDICNVEFLLSVFRRHSIEAVIHFAALKSVGESVVEPLPYYRTNLAGLITLLEVMEKAECRTLIYSSSAAVYGDTKTLPIREDAPRSHSNPYGHTKLVGEEILESIQKADPRWKVVILRYFNPVGAHPSGLLGETPTAEPTNLMPYLSQVAAKQRSCLKIFGNDYPTPDGTGVRDYIHIVDLAEGHVAALHFLSKQNRSGIFNLGTGRGYSVLEMIAAYERASGHPVPYEFKPRRPGDVAISYADASNANTELNWQTTRGLDQMCKDAWRWQRRNS
jgi:UDP-glucose 4-epimerase